MATNERGPLAGLRVVDLSPTQVGAQASQTLADFGADVVWVEPPGGAPLRAQPSFPFIARGKRSVVADLGTSEGVERVRGLAEAADVLIETFRPGVAERKGLGFDELAARNPALVYASITGFGRRGPWANLKGYEGVVAALLAVNASFGGIHRAEHPPIVSVPWCSFSASQLALHGILTALVEREHSGHGQWVETSLAQAFTTLDPWMWFLYIIGERWPDAYMPVEAVSPRGIPNSPMSFALLTAQTREGRWLQFAQNAPRLFRALMRELGLDHLLDDPDWKGIPDLDTEEQRAQLWYWMLSAARAKSLDEWDATFSANHDVFAEMYRTGPEVLDHPQLTATDLVVEITDHERGPVRQPGPIARMSCSPAVVGTSAPKLSADETMEWEPRAAARSEPAPVSALPLEGVVVLEFAVLYAAPFAATLLTDLGARVIKLEQIEGDPVRTMAGFPESGGAKATQGKESVALDISTTEGREIVYRLAERADVVLEGYRDGAAERLQVDAATLRRINPNLVYLSAHGYGVGGPYGDRPAFAPSIGAAGGLAATMLGDSVPHVPGADLDEIGERSHRIRAGATSRYATADGFAALGAATALLLGLVARQRGAGGQHIASSMLLTTAHSLPDHVVEFPGSPGGPAPGADMRGPSALYRIYDAADGWVFLAAPQPDEWDDLANALAPYVDLRSDPRFATEADRRANDDALAAVLTAAFASRSKDDWQRDLTAADVACVAVNTGLNEPLLMGDVGRASGYVVDVDHPTFGNHPRIAPVLRFSRSTTQAKPGVLCGSATDAVLAELGYSEDEVADLRTRGVIG